MIRNPGRDDYSILIALTFTIGYMLEILVLKANHLGFPSSTITMANAVIQLKVSLAVEATYYMIVGAIKASIVDLYLRFGTFSIVTCSILQTLGRKGRHSRDHN